jgi:repressor LexA
MSNKWNDNRKNVAKFLDTYFAQHDRSPSLSEIAEGTGMWKRSVEIVLQWLQKIEYVELTPGVSRSIRLLNQHVARVPLLGEVQAGSPPFSQEEPPQYVRIDRKLVPFDDPIALRVQGFSMKDAGIMPGDVILLRTQSTARSGDTVVAYLNGGLTVKTFERKKSTINLLPANPSFDTMKVTADDEFRVLGKVMVVLRDLGGCLDIKIEESP